MPRIFRLLFLGALFPLVVVNAGTTCYDGVASALPLADGRKVVVDGLLGEWDRSGAVLCWNAAELAEEQNAAIYFMYDSSYLYIGVEMSLYDHEVTNDNRPQDRFWRGDLVQVRLSTDRSLPYPLPRRKDPRLIKNPAVTCVNLWRNTLDGSDNLYVTPGANLDCPSVLHPAGSLVKTTVGEKTLTIESRVPWSALGVEDGVCPFKPGDTMPAVVDIKWCPGTDGFYTAAVYRRDPGAFAFINIDTWGLIRFEKSSLTPAKSETFASIAARAREASSVDTKGWAKIEFTLPKRAKLSVNIFDENGGVIRELKGGEWTDAGKQVLFWDGRDALGFPCETGKSYKWGAYAHDGLDVTYFGTVGTSGEPPYDTRSGRGGWGGDHGPVVDVACDPTGRYFIWHKNESGRGIVKTDFNGKVLWRTMPFVVDGWGNYSAIAASDGKVYLVYERRTSGNVAIKLVRLDASTGNYDIFPCGSGAIDISADFTDPKLPPRTAVRAEYAFNCAGIAVVGKELFVSDFNGNCLRVLNADTGAEIRRLPCEKPRGVWCEKGVLYVASLAGDSGGQVLALSPNGGNSSIVVSSGLSSPYGVAVDAQGKIYVSDLGASQQVKVFSPKGSILKVMGLKGGRSFLGTLELDSFLMPFGIAVDSTGALIVTEASSPKIVSVFNAETGVLRDRFFGYTSYSPSNIPDCDDPLVQYYSLSGPDSFARARLPETGGVGMPDAVWDFEGAGINEFSSVMSTMNMPEIIRGSNGVKYLASDATPYHRHANRPITICRIDGDDIKPVGAVLCPPRAKGVKTDVLELWMDGNGDGRIQKDEMQSIGQVGDRAFRLSHTPGALHMTADGTLYVLTLENFVIGIPCRGYSSDGVPQWDIKAVYKAIPEIVPGMKELFCTWRQGLMGLRRDSAGNFYASVSCSPDYVTPEFTKYMHQGMGHTADVGAVFLIKYDSKGKLIWCVGRKAVGALRPGEIHHHWCHAGMVGDHYAVAASEWGLFTVYTEDGFFVDTLFDPPGKPGRGIPYTFGGEDFSGRIAYFPSRDEVWAYNAGHTFRVTGFEKGRVKGEWRNRGALILNNVQALVFPGAREKPLSEAMLTRVDSSLKFTARVKDSTPLVNVAMRENAIFKGGDAVGFEIGPSNGHKELPPRTLAKREIGYTRILAARIGGRDVVVALKPFTDMPKKEQEYATPAGGKAFFEFVGEVKGAKVSFTNDSDGQGYRVEISVPESFFELDFTKPVYWDAQVLLSGEGGRGVQTVSRTYLYNPETSATSMVDDTPTESRLRPQGWRRAAFSCSASTK